MRKGVVIVLTFITATFSAGKAIAAAKWVKCTLTEISWPADDPFRSQNPKERIVFFDDTAGSFAEYGLLNQRLTPCKAFNPFGNVNINALCSEGHLHINQTNGEVHLYVSRQGQLAGVERGSCVRIEPMPVIP